MSIFDKNTISNTLTNLLENIMVAKKKLGLCDDSIIDVTNQAEKLPTFKEVSKLAVVENHTAINIPEWKHRYIYSYEDINYANKEQKNFYFKFRQYFLEQKFIDVGNNSNYAFVLLFDLLSCDYKEAKNLKIFEENIFRLIDHYPIVKQYALRGLIKKMQKNGDNEIIQRVNNMFGQDYGTGRVEYYSSTSYGLGDRFRRKLNLLDFEVKLLNRVYNSSNVFLQIEFCCIAVIKFYLLVIQQMNENLKSRATDLYSEFKLIANIEYDIFYGKEKHRFLSYKPFFIELTINNLYTYVFRCCEATVRECYSYNRKLQNKAILGNIADEALEQIKPEIQSVISLRINDIMELDEDSEIKLNKYCASRWKLLFKKYSSQLFEKICNEFASLTDKNNKNSSVGISLRNDSSNDLIDDYYWKILNLASLNWHNSKIVQNIYYEAFKTVVQFDKQTAVKFYFLYLDSSDKLNFKIIPKKLQKALFVTAEQLSIFEEIKTKFLNSLNLSDALNCVANIYVMQSKKIILNKSQIKEIQQQHLGTAKLLHEYLSDEEDVQIISQPNPCAASESVFVDNMIIGQSAHNILKSNSEDSKIDEYEDNKKSKLDTLQLEFIKLFAKNDFSLSLTAVDQFMAKNNVFKNSTVDKINEMYYDLLDDVLIEQIDESYQINRDYYERIWE